MTTPVTPPPVLPPRFGLVAASEGFDDGVARWQAGITWENDLCSSLGGIEDICTPDNLTVGTEECDPGSATPFVIWQGVKRSTFNSEQSAVAAALARLERYTSYMLEIEFWYGAAAITNGWQNPYLADGTAVEVMAGAIQPMLKGLAELQQDLMAYNQTGMIHMCPRALAIFLANDSDIFTMQDGKLKDMFGNIIVAGSGYGYGEYIVYPPSDVASWMFATGNVAVRLSEPEINVIVDQTNNDRLVIASRFAVAYFNPCVQIAVYIDHCTMNCSAGLS